MISFTGGRESSPRVLQPGKRAHDHRRLAVVAPGLQPQAHPVGQRVQLNYDVKTWVLPQPEHIHRRQIGQEVEPHPGVVLEVNADVPPLFPRDMDLFRGGHGQFCFNLLSNRFAQRFFKPFLQSL